MIAVFHNVRSLHNVGSMFRTADASGVEKIYLTGYTPTPLDKFGQEQTKLTKVALGAHKFVAWEHCSSAAVLLSKLKKNGWQIVAVEQSPKSIPYQKVKFSSKQLAKVVLVMGNEVKGLSKAILNKADKIVEIPMFGQKESLNVAVAFGIVAFGLKLK